MGHARRMVGVALVLAGAVLAGAVLAGAVLLAPHPAGALDPVPGTATVDGSAAEWTAADEVAPLLGNDPPHREVGRLSLRYDCAEEVLYALLAAGPGVRFEAVDVDEAYLRLGDEPKLVSGDDGDDGVAPDAAWVDRAGGTAAGIELSTPLAPGDHPDLRVHAKVPDASEDGYETVDLSPRYEQLDIACAAEPAAVEVAVVPDADADADGDAAAADTRDPGDPSGLARTGAPLLPALAVAGAVLLALGATVRVRRWGRPATP